MSKAEANHDSPIEPPTVNGVALDSIEGVRRAFDYLDDDYNGGDIYKLATLTGNEAVAIESRSPSFQHMSSLMDARCGGFIEIGPITAMNDGRLKIEVHEA